MSNIVPTTEGPKLDGKVAVVTGGSSGIGLATARVLALKGARVFNLDPSPPPSSDVSGIQWIQTNQASWPELLVAFDQIERVDIAVANGGITEKVNYFEDTFDAEGRLTLNDGFIDVNLKGTLQFVKLAVSRMRRQGDGGSVVVVTSATGYLPECGLPVYGACKAALANLIRALRPVLPADNITINGVAPAATITAQIPPHLLAPIQQLGLPLSSAEHVGWAVYHSATASQPKRVDDYGNDTGVGEGRWNGRTLLTLGDAWTEIEEPLAQCKTTWWGKENVKMTMKQQAATDPRPQTNGKK